jgi:type III restriction enzyme
MALHKDFPQSAHAIVDPGIRWFLADESLREGSMEKLTQPLVPALCHTVKEFQDGGTWAQRTRARACSISGSTGRT